MPNVVLVQCCFHQDFEELEKDELKAFAGAWLDRIEAGFLHCCNTSNGLKDFQGSRLAKELSKLLKHWLKNAGNSGVTAREASRLPLVSVLGEKG